MNKSRFTILVLSVLFALMLASCGGNSTQAPADTSDQSSQTSDDTDSSDTTTSDTSSDTTTADDNSDDSGDEVVQQVDTGVGSPPDDLPIMDGAYNLDIISDGSNVNFQIDGDIDTVLTYYQTMLPDFGWMETRSPDSAIGSIGTMARENEAGDKLSLNMQYNQNGPFVIVQIALVRAK